MCPLRPHPQPSPYAPVLAFLPGARLSLLLLLLLLVVMAGGWCGWCGRGHGQEELVAAPCRAVGGLLGEHAVQAHLDSKQGIGGSELRGGRSICCRHIQIIIGPRRRA